MIVNNKFNLNEIVYLTTDLDQKARLVISLQISTNGILYLLSLGAESSWHYDIEISKDRNMELLIFN